MQHTIPSEESVKPDKGSRAPVVSLPMMVRPLGMPSGADDTGGKKTGKFTELEDDGR
ncbi:MAG: hypothetical protein HKP44_13290 [Desulfofustis sp.]|nr:hypothetical protein [Desulfofustis sp.]